MTKIPSSLDLSPPLLLCAFALLLCVNDCHTICISILLAFSLFFHLEPVTDWPPRSTWNAPSSCLPANVRFFPFQRLSLDRPRLSPKIVNFLEYRPRPPPSDEPYDNLLNLSYTTLPLSRIVVSPSPARPHVIVTRPHPEPNTSYFGDSHYGRSKGPVLVLFRRPRSTLPSSLERSETSDLHSRTVHPTRPPATLFPI